MKHQEKVNDLKSTCETLGDEKRMLTQRVRDLEVELEKHKNSKIKSDSDDVQLVRSKLIVAETKIEELTEENNDLNKEICNMEQEMRDNFRYINRSIFYLFINVGTYIPTYNVISYRVT